MATPLFDPTLPADRLAPPASASPASACSSPMRLPRPAAGDRAAPVRPASSAGSMDRARYGLPHARSPRRRRRRPTARAGRPSLRLRRLPADITTTLLRPLRPSRGDRAGRPPSTRTIRRRRSTSTASTSWPCEQFHLLYGNVHGLRRSRAAAHERVRAPPAPRARWPRLPARVRPAGAARRGHRAVRRRHASGATACTSTTSSTPCSLAAATPDAAGEIFNLGHPDSLSAAPTIAGRDRRRRGRGRRSTLRAVARGLARIDIGSFQGDFSKAKRVLGWEPRIGFADGIARHVGYYRRPLVVPVVDLRRRHRRLRATRSSPPSSRVLGVGHGAARPETRRARGRAARPASGAPPTTVVRRRAVPRRCSWRCRRSASGRATRSSCRRSPPCRRRRPCARSGATPVPVDVDAATAALDPGRAPPTAITARTRAIMPVHLYGRPAPSRRC